MRNKILLVIIVIFWFRPASGQYRPILNHFYDSPFLINPAYAGEDYRPSFFVSHRRQWMGIDGAPLTSNFYFHSPLGSKFAIGLQFNHDVRGILNSSAGQIAIAYKAMFSTNHFIKFGLSGGVINKGINDWDEIMNNPKYQNDNAIMKMLEKTIFLDGRFGINYHLKGLNIDLSLPDLLSVNFFEDNVIDEYKLKPLNSFLAMIHYKSNNNSIPVSFEPWLIFRMEEDTGEKQFEGAGIIRFRNVAWIGGIYRQDGDMSALGGFTIKDGMSLGYSYDFSTLPINGLSGGAHEIMLRLNLGKEKRPVKPLNERPQKNKNIPFVPSSNDEVDSEGRILDYKGPTIIKEDNGIQGLKKGYYIVAEVFRNIDKAEEYSNKLFQQGFYASYGRGSREGYCYLYIYFERDDKSAAEAVLESFRQRPMFGKAWLLTVE